MRVCQFRHFRERMGRDTGWLSPCQGRSRSGRLAREFLSAVHRDREHQAAHRETTSARIDQSLHVQPAEQLLNPGLRNIEPSGEHFRGRRDIRSPELIQRLQEAPSELFLIFVHQIWRIAQY